MQSKRSQILFLVTAILAPLFLWWCHNTQANMLLLHLILFDLTWFDKFLGLGFKIQCGRAFSLWTNRQKGSFWNFFDLNSTESWLKSRGTQLLCLVVSKARHNYYIPSCSKKKQRRRPGRWSCYKLQTMTAAKRITLMLQEQTFIRTWWHFSNKKIILKNDTDGFSWRKMRFRFQVFSLVCGLRQPLWQEALSSNKSDWPTWMW